MVYQKHTLLTEAPMFRRHLATSLLIALCLSALASTAVLAKGGVVTLDAQLPSDPQPGSDLTIGWTVGTPLENGTTAPFSAEGMFVRIVPPSGEPVEAIGTEGPTGHYTATIVVPEGGIRDVEFGLRGESCIGGVCERSDLMFGVAEAPAEPAPAVVEAAPPAQEPVVSQSSSESAQAPALDLPVLLAVLGGVAILAGIGATMARGRRLEPGSTR